MPGIALRTLRELRKLSQEDLATASGLERVEVSKIENGVNQARSYRIRTALARGLGLTLDQIAGLLEGRLPPEDLVHPPANDSKSSPLRDLPSWPAAAERARLAVDELDAPLVDEVGGFVPPAPIARVTVALVTALVGAWKGVRPVGDLPPLARPTTFASPAVGEARSVGAEAEGKSGKGKRKK